MANVEGAIFVGDKGMEVAITMKDGAAFFDEMFFLSSEECVRLADWLNWHFGHGFAA